MGNRTTIQITENLRKELKILASKRDTTYEDLLNEMVLVFKELDNTKTIVSLPKKLADKLQQNLQLTDFATMSEYITFVLRLMLYETPKKEDNETEAIKDKLKAMGYLQ